jgi:PhnB protein
MDHMTDKNPAPAGLPRLTTFFAVDDCAKAIDFYREVFGTEVVRRMESADGVVMHCEMLVGDTLVHLSEPMPAFGIVGPPAQGNAFTLTYWVPDPDALFDKAVAAGATAVSPVDDAFTGDRMGVLRDPFGVRWCLARHDRDVPDDEVEAAARAWSDQG